MTHVFFPPAGQILKIPDRLRQSLDRLNRIEDMVLDRLGPRLPGVLLLFWVALLLGLGYFFHEPWRDETQSWLMARDMSLVQLLRNAGTEGHPIGWHLLIKPLAMSGLPFTSLRVFNSLLVFGAAALVIFRPPFRLWQKWIIVSTPAFVVCGIYARSYSLVLLLLCLHAAFYAKRMERPLLYAAILGGLANTMVLCLPYAAGMGAYWLWEAAREGRLRPGSRVLFGLVLLVLMGLAACAQILPSPEKASFMLASRLPVALEELANKPLQVVVSFLLLPSLFCVPILLNLKRRDPVLPAIFLLQAAFFVFVHLFVYFLFFRHFLILLTSMTAMVWIVLEKKATDKKEERATASLLVWFIIVSLFSCIESVEVIRKDIIRLSSNVPGAVPYVARFLRDEPVAAHFLTRISPLSAYIPGMRFWNPASRRWESYAVFDMNWLKRGEMPAAKAVGIILRECPVNRPPIILSLRWMRPEADGYRLVHVADRRNSYAENVFIYMPVEKLKPGMTPLHYRASVRERGKR